MKSLITAIFKFLPLSLFLLVLSSCGPLSDTTTAAIGNKNTGCKGTFFLEPEHFVRNDSISAALTKGLGVFDIALQKILNPSSVLSPIETADGENNYKYFKQRVAIYKTRTPEQLATAWNANMISFCARKKDLKKMMRSKRYTEKIRDMAGERFFLVDSGWDVFLEILNNRIAGIPDTRTIEDDIIKKKLQS
ncbi:hypothetical protein FVB32_05410 [Flagellimonas hymeniacidonis]|uniref:Lipoprotein n=1 Tax=Flagellimonas hymeniacidonis TaxID=2603628 RepID=A0A5C8V7R9_9FLAO|nr:hypothetical protein [Flagellimonas hymeniacidonis]TXN37727.1 hypothetical protein FVB32_05410 [Flagellimonas hymeniacidonis]